MVDFRVTKTFLVFVTDYENFEYHLPDHLEDGVQVIVAHDSPRCEPFLIKTSVGIGALKRSSWELSCVDDSLRLIKARNQWWHS